MNEDKTTKTIIYGILIFGFIVLVSTIILIWYTSSTGENSIYLKDEKIIVKYYGFNTEIKIEDINYVELIAELPVGGKFGAGIEDNHHIAGDAKYQDIGKCKAYLIKNNSPYILLKTEKKVYIINDEKPNVTQEIYHYIDQNI